jgi:hypothetical protein
LFLSSSSSRCIILLPSRPSHIFLNILNTLKHKGFEPGWLGQYSGVSMSLTTKECGFYFVQEKENILISISSETAVGHTQPPIQSVAGVKRPNPEAHHESLSTFEVKIL